MWGGGFFCLIFITLFVSGSFKMLLTSLNIDCYSSELKLYKVIQNYICRSLK